MVAHEYCFCSEHDGAAVVTYYCCHDCEGAGCESCNGKGWSTYQQGRLFR